MQGILPRIGGGFGEKDQLEMRRNGNVINLAYNRRRARELSKDSDFKRSNRWIYKFLDRKQFVVRKKTTTLSKAPGELSLRDFYYLNRMQVLQKQENFDSVWNMDETGVFYDNAGPWTYDKKGIKDVYVKGPYAQKRKLSVAVVVGLVNGRGVIGTPLIIFKNS